MKIKQYCEKVFPYIVVDDFYSKQEEKFIWHELDVLMPLFHKENEESGARGIATTKNKKLADLKRVYLDEIYQLDRSQSAILKFYSKKLFSKKVINAYKIVPSWVTYEACNIDWSQVSYYENKNFYKKHQDVFMHTALIWFYREPKKFKGGDLNFPEIGQTVECKHNRLLLFPSYYKHEAEKVFMHADDLNTGFGRYCLTHFFSRR